MDESKKYRCSKEEAFDIFYNDIFPEIKSEYEKVLEITASHGLVHFKEGIYRILDKYKKHTGKYVAPEMIRSLARANFIESNIIVERVVLAYLKLELCTKLTFIMTSRVASVALRALRFEAFGQTEEGYTTISEDECRNFVLNNDTFRSEIDEHPYDTDKYTEEFINKIINPNCLPKISTTMLGCLCATKIRIMRIWCAISSGSLPQQNMKMASLRIQTMFMISFLTISIA